MATTIDPASQAPAIAATQPELQAEIITRASDFAALRPEWDELLTASRAAIFNSWEWLYPWYQHLGSARQLLIMLARGADGQLLGLLPLSIEQRNIGPLV